MITVQKLRTPPWQWEVHVDDVRLVIDLQCNNAGTEFHAWVERDGKQYSGTVYDPERWLDEAIHAYEQARQPELPWDDIKRELRARGAFR